VLAYPFNPCPEVLTRAVSLIVTPDILDKLSGAVAVE
jgi:hypothetical protein